MWFIEVNMDTNLLLIVRSYIFSLSTIVRPFCSIYSIISPDFPWTKKSAIIQISCGDNVLLMSEMEKVPRATSELKVYLWSTHTFCLNVKLNVIWLSIAKVFSINNTPLVINLWKKYLKRTVRLIWKGN